MNGRINGLVKVAASASLVAGVVMATAGPAAAAGGPNTSDGAAATGLITIAPVAPASSTGTTSNQLANVNLGGGLLQAGLITDTADATGSTSTIASPTLDLTALVTLTAGTITSSCSIDTNTGAASGTSGITNGTITALGGLLTGPINLAANAAPNTTVSVPGVATITLNRQVVTGDTLEVDALYVSLLGTTQTLTVGTSVCAGTTAPAPVPVLPGMALPIGLGALGVLGLGGVGFAVARRRRAAVAA
jgi:hypothetical protein